MEEEDNTIEMTQLRYRVTAATLREQFKKKAERALKIATEWSGKDDNMCAHGIVTQHEHLAEQFERRANMLADGEYLLDGELMDAIFDDVEEPDEEANKYQEAQRIRNQPTGMKSPHRY